MLSAWSTEPNSSGLEMGEVAEAKRVKATLGLDQTEAEMSRYGVIGS